MSWVAAVAPGGAAQVFPPFDKLPPRGAMRRGTVLLECSPSPVAAARSILRIPLQAHAAGHLSILALPQGSFALVVAQGKSMVHRTLRLNLPEGNQLLRLSFSWDCEVGLARFAVERADGQGFVTGALDLPEPMALESLTAFPAMEVCTSEEAGLGFLAISNRVEPVGPLPGLAARTFVGTPFGAREVSRLRIGDLVQTRDGGPEPVLHVAQRIVPGLGSFAPIRLRAPYFGLERDIVVAPHQKIFVSGAAVDYTFGCEGVLVPAGYLVNGQSALPEPNLPLVNYAQALLPPHAVFAASGAWTESLYVGRLRRDSEKLAATLLAEVRPTLLPEQAHLTPPVLKRFEAQALAEVA
ncbi:Hint domain-containing protein [Marinovum algicola]|uniref:Hint domain-containing protein n=1 Tax=Marinovum algicola TaxID=42444 RepID=UPI0024BB8504|nr:Hint domain-containing protein [Marinovum algicola]